jgi:D-glycero-alpha-D-manno-heptose 1-phosphate guanylyltransferase
LNKEVSTTNDPIAPFRNGGGITEAIILAGGLGTRLRDAVPDLPKCMAPVAGRPFLFHVINYLRSQGVEYFIFSLGYKHELIEEYLAAHFSTLRYTSVIEEEPLGTGGAIQLACTKASRKNVIVTNGDTLFTANLHTAALFHYRQMAECTLLLKPMRNFDRYGMVELDDEMLVKNFKEKQFYQQGAVNGGLYILNKDKFLDEEFPAKFSFEKNYLEAMYKERRIYGQVQDEYFIDIGIPEDLSRAGLELTPSPLHLKTIDKSWTLFLDRDGVINEDKPGSYIFNADEFKFTEGGPALFKTLGEKFGTIIVVTNQRGVGRGLMTEADLAGIHTKMITAIESTGSHIDGIYYATSISNDDPMRKPNPGMAFKAKADFPSIDFSKSIMVGNKLSDMQFGKNVGMYTIFIASTNPETPFPHPDINFRMASLHNFVKAL